MHNSTDEKELKEEMFKWVFVCDFSFNGEMKRKGKRLAGSIILKIIMDSHLLWCMQCSYPCNGLEK